MTLTVASYNIRDGGAGRVDALARVLRTVDADVVALLEASDPSVAAELAALLGMALVHGEPRRPLGMHVAWLSRVPATRAENHALPALAKTLLELEIEWDGAPLRLFATHLASRHEADAHPREREAEAILDVLRRAGDRQLLVGDLNALHPEDVVGTPPAGVLLFGEAVPGAARSVLPRFLDAGYADCFRQLHPVEPGYTYTAETPWLRLDYVLATPGVADRIVRCEVVRSPGTRSASDHLPVVATIEERWALGGGAAYGALAEHPAALGADRPLDLVGNAGPLPERVGDASPVTVVEATVVEALAPHLAHTVVPRSFGVGSGG